MSISETETTHAQEERVGEDENMLIICVDVGKHIEWQNMGIGITAENIMSQICAAWILKKRSTGAVALDNFLAIRLALCKIKEQGWQYIKIQTPCFQVLRLIRCQASRDICTATHLEDIKDLSSMFRTCSFDS